MKNSLALKIILVLLYFCLVATPILIMIGGGSPRAEKETDAVSEASIIVEESNDTELFWIETSVIFGFIGLSMMGIQFVITARLKPIHKPFGSDKLYYFHHLISLLSFVLVIAHPLILALTFKEGFGIINIFNEPWGTKLGIISVIALIILISIVFIKKFAKINYTIWRLTHGLLAITVVTTALIHILLTGNYVDTLIEKIIWIAYSVICFSFMLNLRVIKPLKQLGNPYELIEKKNVTDEAFIIRIKTKNNKTVSFCPGQFAWLTVKSSPFFVSENPFSIASSSENPAIMEFGIKKVGDFTEKLSNAKTGETVYIDAPYGSFTMDRYPDANGLVFIAGGIGITPFVSMLRTMCDRGDKRDVILFYAHKCEELLIYKQEIEDMKKHLNLKTVYILEKISDDMDCEKGFFSREILKNTIEKRDMDFFICGPAVMMDNAEKILKQENIKSKNIHSERFDFM